MKSTPSIPLLSALAVLIITSAFACTPQIVVPGDGDADGDGDGDGDADGDGDGDGDGDACAGIDCSHLDGNCVVGECDPATLACAAVDAADGTACNDANFCTEDDSCSAGVCAGTPVDCSELEDACTTAGCQPSTGECIATALPDYAPCDDLDPCTSDDVCVGGACGGTARDCSGFDDPCNTGVCDPATGACTTERLPDGTACNDGDLCTAADLCTDGVCAGTPVGCTGIGDACNTGACDPATGRCVAEPLADGTLCDDGDICTTPDRCIAGACASTAVDCSHLTSGCDLGTCHPVSGACSTTPAPDGTTCDDGDPATVGDRCTAGICEGSTGGTTITPGDTTTAVSRDGWSVRCLAWSGARCTHLQTMMECYVCPAYSFCGLWHDMTSYNNGGNRMTANWCALATGDPGIVSQGPGGAASSPYGCGWGSSSHPHCEAVRASYHVPVAGVSTSYGLLLNDTYCRGATTRMELECSGW